ncbi:MAG: hypothetical protein Q8P78_00555 [bacterium]|nr:hypothetical protein [bacterium]
MKIFKLNNGLHITALGGVVLALVIVANLGTGFFQITCGCGSPDGIVYTETLIGALEQTVHEVQEQNGQYPTYEELKTYITETDLDNTRERPYPHLSGIHEYTGNDIDTYGLHYAQLEGGKNYILEGYALVNKRRTIFGIPVTAGKETLVEVVRE